jgi:hypothetical protein
MCALELGWTLKLSLDLEVKVAVKTIEGISFKNLALIK